MALDSCKRCTCNRKCVLQFLKNNKLILLTLLGVLVGGIFGLVLRQFDVPDDVKVWIKIWGELFVRMLKMIILPLIMCSLITGVASMDVRSGGRLGLVTIIYHFTVNFLSIMIAVVFSLAIRPGRYWLQGNEEIVHTYDGSNGDLHNSSYLMNKTVEMTPEKVEDTTNYSDIFADFLRNLVPDNIIKACLENVYTNRETVLTEGLNGTVSSETSASLVYRDGTNTMGVIIFSLAIGVAMSVAGEEGRPLYNMVDSLLKIIFIMLKVIIWYSPFAIASLVMSSVMEIENITSVLTAISLYVVTFLISGFIHMFCFLPLLYFIIVRKNPYVFFFKYVATGVLAGFGPPTSAVGVPVLMKTYKETKCVDQRVSDFFLSLAISVSRSGSAMFIMSALMFVAQTYPAGISGANIMVAVLLITILAAAASVVPSSSVMLLLTVAPAVNVVIGDRLAVIMAMEWILDRMRTCNNVTSSGFGCAIVEKLCIAHLNRQQEKQDISKKSQMENDILLSEDKV